MKALSFMLISSFILSAAYGAKIQDVKVLDLKYEKNSFEVKLHAREGGPGSYFLVDIVKEDEKALEKLALILKKVQKKDSFKLNLDIPSFSAKPSGAYYRSPTVKIEGSAQGSLIGP